jgi:hypothetical protein
MYLALRTRLGKDKDCRTASGDFRQIIATHIGQTSPLLSMADRRNTLVVCNCEKRFSLGYRK